MTTPSYIENAVPGGSPYRLSAVLFPNIESFPGQLLVTPPRMSAKQEGRIGRKDAVRRARQMERTAEPIRGGLDRKADMVIGGMITVHPEPDWEMLGLDAGEQGWKTKKPFAQQLARVFNNWAYDTRLLCDAEGHYDFGGMMWMAYRNLIGPDAESVGVIHFEEARRAQYNTRWGTFVTLVDPDRVNTPGELAGDTSVDEGLRLDQHGRTIGLYIDNQHPSEGQSTAGPGYTYVPRETAWGRPMAWHWFEKTRGGQLRGLSKMITVLKKSGMLNELDDALIGSAILAQVLGTYVETLATAETVAEQLAPGPDNGPSAWEQKFGYYDKYKVKVGPVRVPVLPPGDKIIMQAVGQQLADPAGFRNGFLREFASSLGLSFEQLAQNFSEANYSSARAALLEVWRGVLRERRMFTAHVCTLIYGAVIEEAIELGLIELPTGAPPFQENRAAYIKCRWTGPGMGWIDPLKEATAMQVRLETKTTSRQKECAANGDDYLEVFDQIEQEEAEAEERNFSLEMNPAQIAANAVPEPGDGNSPTAPKPKPKPAPAQQDK